MKLQKGILDISWWGSIFKKIGELKKKLNDFILVVFKLYKIYFVSRCRMTKETYYRYCQNLALKQLLSKISLILNKKYIDDETVNNLTAVLYLHISSHYSMIFEIFIWNFIFFQCIHELSNFVERVIFAMILQFQKFTFWIIWQWAKYTH